MFKFQAVLTHCQPFCSGSVRNGATNPDSNAEKWSIIVQFAVICGWRAGGMQAGRPDELRQTLKELGMKKLGHREKLLSALL